MSDRIKERLKRICLVGAISILTLVICVTSAYSLMIPKTVSCFSGESVPSFLGATFYADGSMESGAASTQGEYRLFGAIPVKSVTVKRLQDAKVYVGGIPFGLKFSTKGALVVGFENESSSPAYKAGLRLYDTVTKINGKEIKGATDLTKAIEGGAEVTLTYERAGREATVKFKPGYSESEKRYSLGIYLKDSGAGIGTLTYVLADGSFGGLGHGICDGETGELTPINGGSVLDVCINGIVRGNRGAPGELKGYFNSSKVGSIAKNTECGVFGALASIPEKISDKTYSIGLKGDLNEGAATILCTLDDNVRREYTVEISNINRNATGNKCFTLKVTDPDLIGKTGGIVQGMSGTPIIQNGKLVGAITHVMINDPTVGYGIFIENMISQTTALEPPTNIAA